MKSRTLVIPEPIERRILLIRGEKVLMDRDLASLYAVGTRDLNKAVQRNRERFPSDFMFRLTKEELQNLMFQNGTSRWGGTRKLPHVFTEQGVAMLSSVTSFPTSRWERAGSKLRFTCIVQGTRKS